MRQGIFKKEQLAKWQPVVEDSTAAAIYLLSLAGGLLWGAGGVARIMDGEPSITGLLIALLVQAVCTGVQWVYASKPFSFPYIAALIVSATTTALGYAPIVVPVLTEWIGTLTPYAPIVAWLAIGLVSLGADVIPERRFVR